MRSAFTCRTVLPGRVGSEYGFDRPSNSAAALRLRRSLAALRRGARVRDRSGAAPPAARYPRARATPRVRAGSRPFPLRPVASIGLCASIPCTSWLEPGPDRPLHPEIQGRPRQRALCGPIRKGKPPYLRKHLALLLAATLAVSVASTPARSSVILSELCDPLSNYPTDRFIEIYNIGPDAVDLTGWSRRRHREQRGCAAPGASRARSPPGEAKVAGYTTPVALVHRALPERELERADQRGRRLQLEWQDRRRRQAQGAGDVIVDQVVAPGVLFKDADMVRESERHRRRSRSTRRPSGPSRRWTPPPTPAPARTTARRRRPAGPRISNVVIFPATPGRQRPGQRRGRVGGSPAARSRR